MKTNITPELIEKYSTLAQKSFVSEPDADFTRLDEFLRNNANVLCLLINSSAVGSKLMMHISKDDNDIIEINGFITVGGGGAGNSEYDTKVGGGIAIGIDNTWRTNGGTGDLSNIGNI